jgi:hypothetical protein
MNKDNKNIMMLYENAMQQPTMTVDRYGNKIWKLDGKRHREDGPAFVLPNGDKTWYLHGKVHREDGPAHESVNGYKYWCLHGEFHREDGPAIENANGHKGWYLHGKRYEDVVAWAKALLKLKGINDPSEDQINDKVQQVTSSSILD